jgi:hypothetical protein
MFKALVRYTIQQENDEEIKGFSDFAEYSICIPTCLVDWNLLDIGFLRMIPGLEGELSGGAIRQQDILKI